MRVRKVLLPRGPSKPAGEPVLPVDSDRIESKQTLRSAPKEIY